MDIAREPRKRTTANRLAWALGIVALGLIAVGIARLRPAAPILVRSAILIDVARRGVMRREVHAAGALVPEHVRIVAAITAGRIEQLPLRPGDAVAASTVIVDLSNPDVQLQALQAAQAVTEAEAAVASLRTSLVQQQLAHEASIATLRTQHQSAVRAAAVQEELDRKALTAASDLQAARDAVTEFETRMQLERRGLDELRRSAAEQLRLGQARAAGLRAIVREQQSRVAAMRVVAGERGILQTLGNPSLEVGQWVNSGFELARVAQPGKLKAVLRVPELEAKDLAVGQRATIDTRSSLVPGHVVRADPSSQSGTVTVEVSLDGALGAGTRSDLNIDGTIELERLSDVVFVTRPANVARQGTVGLFRIEPNTGYASRVQVRLGRVSDNTVEILQGLAPGDSVIISDVSLPDNITRVRLR